MLARLAAPPIDAVRVDGVHLHRGDGAVATVIESGDVDVTALDSARRGVAIAAFARLCRSLDCPLQIVVQVRHWEGGGEIRDAPPLGAQLGIALREAGQ